MRGTLAWCFLNRAQFAELYYCESRPVNPGICLFWWLFFLIKSRLTLKIIITINLKVCICERGHMHTTAHTEEVLEIYSCLLLWVPGIELRQSGLQALA